MSDQNATSRAIQIAEKAERSLRPDLGSAEYASRLLTGLIGRYAAAGNEQAVNRLLATKDVLNKKRGI